MAHEATRYEDGARTRADGAATHGQAERRRIEAEAVQRDGHLVRQRGLADGRIVRVDAKVELRHRTRARAR